MAKDKKALPFSTPGTFLRIPLADGSFGYGRVLGDPYTAFYAYRTDKPSADLDEIERRPILFSQVVRFSDPRRWVPLGVRELRGEVAKPVVRFMQDLANPLRCTIYDSAGSQRSATPEECVGLERAAVWEQHHIEQRLLDTFLGRPNVVEMHMRVRLPGKDGSR